jgi:hypothetical protein
MILLVGAGQIERPTACAQGSFRPLAESAYFQVVRFQADAGGLLRTIEV